MACNTSTSKVEKSGIQKKTVTYLKAYFGYLKDRLQVVFFYGLPKKGILYGLFYFDIKFYLFLRMSQKIVGKVV